MRALSLCGGLMLALGLAACSAESEPAQPKPAPRVETPEPAPEPDPEPKAPPTWEPAFVADQAAATCEPKACAKLGREHYDSLLGTDNPDEIREEAYMMQRRACTAGLHEGCYEQAMLLRSGLVLGVNERELADARVTELFEASCAGGWGRSCYRLGEDHHDTPEGHRYYKRSIELYEPACEGGDMLQCSLLAYNLQQGRGAMTDVVRANALYKKACEGGDGYGCEMHGRMLAKPPRGIEKDSETAVKMFRRACELEAPFYGCYEGGQRLARGRGVKANVQEGVDMLRSGCTDDTGVADARACNELEDLCREGFEQACS